MNVQWKGSDNLQWTFDAGNKFLSFWKEMPMQEQPVNEKPQYNKDEIKQIADAFLDAHGFSSIRATGGEVDDSSYQVMIKESEKVAAMPCAFLRSDIAPTAAVPPPAPDAIVKPEATTAGDAMRIDPAMYPSPCNWWPQQISVYYNTTREGLPVVEVGGWPNRSNSVTVDLRTKQVTNGVLQLDQTFERSSYPLIDLATATQKLMTGGTNPMYSWGVEGTKTHVTISSVQLVWMRYDSWVSGHMETYYLPALAAMGTVDRGMKDQPTEEYRTSVPLVADAAFQDTLTPPPVAIPMMIDAAVAPVAVPAPTPYVK
jgi:hypothetical protein